MEPGLKPFRVDDDDHNFVFVYPQSPTALTEEQWGQSDSVGDDGGEQ